jgi:hypothetical protein
MNNQISLIPVYHDFLNPGKDIATNKLEKRRRIEERGNQNNFASLEKFYREDSAGGINLSLRVVRQLGLFILPLITLYH